jgi:hypothetical protein
MPRPADHLSERDHETLHLAHQLRERMTTWLSHRKVTNAVILVSPYVDPTGTPSALIRTGPHIIHATLLSFDEHHHQQHPHTEVQPFLSI